MRTFSKNLANYMSLGVGALGPLLNGKAAISVSAQITATSVTAGVNDNNILCVIINGVNVGLVWNVNGTGPRMRMSLRSVAADSRVVCDDMDNTLTLGVPTFVGGVASVAFEAFTFYRDGLLRWDAAGTPAPPSLANGTWTLGTPTAADTIGGYKAPPTATTDQFDGQIGEIALWGVALSDADFLALATGTPASSVQAGNLLYYLPIGGVASPEPPTVGIPVGTITGSLPQTPPINPAWARQANQFLSGVNS